MRSINPGVACITAQHGQVPLDRVLGIGAFDPKTASAIHARASAALEVDRADGTGKGRHSTGVQPVVLEATKPLDDAKFGRWIKSLVEAPTALLYQLTYKGFDCC